MSVQRFDSDHSLAPFDDGAYVRYEDYAKLEKALELVIATPDHPMRNKCKDIARNALADKQEDKR